MMSYSDDYYDYSLAIWTLQNLMEQDSPKRTAKDLYRNTAGEIEARNTAGRRNLSAEERKNTPPILGGEDTVFADETGISFDQQVSEYPYDMQTVIHGYIDAVDEDVLSFIEEVQNGQAWKGKKITVGTANSRMVGDIADLTGAERRLLNDLGGVLGVTKFQNREKLQGIVREIADEYLEQGRVREERMDFLFDQAYAEGIVEDASMVQQYGEIRNHLRTTGVTLSRQDQSDIPDYQDYMVQEVIFLFR